MDSYEVMAQADFTQFPQWQTLTNTRWLTACNTLGSILGPARMINAECR